MTGTSSQNPTAGLVTAQRLRDGTSVALSYDSLGRATLTNWPGTTPDVTTAYDSFGRVTSLTQTGHALTYVYDQLSRLVSEAQPNGTVSYQYDAAGRRTKLTWPGSFFVDYDWNAAGDLLKIREDGATSGVGVLASFAYDNLGRRTSLTRGSGGVTSYGFDAAVVADAGRGRDGGRPCQRLRLQPGLADRVRDDDQRRL